MDVEYPDIISEYVVVNERYECDGIQLVPSLEPAHIAVGGSSILILLLQNALDVPAEITIVPEMPASSRPKGAPILEIGQPTMNARLEPAQVGSLFVPVQATAQAPEGQYEVRLNLAAKTTGTGNRIRPVQTAGRFRSHLIDDVVGLELGRVLGVAYSVIPTRKISLPITVQGRADPTAEKPAMVAKFESLWKVEQAARQARAQQAVEDQRSVILTQLSAEPLYAALFAEGLKRFAQAGVQLRVGEAIALGKILTHTALHFLGSRNLQDGLLVPIWESAAELNLPINDALLVVRRAGFSHLLRLSVALSFGLAAQAIQRQPWELEERRGLIQLIPDTVEAGETLPVEFLYIPLLIGAATVARQVVLNGEDVAHSLGLLRKAKAARADVFNDPDLAQASRVFDQVLQAAL
jgi:hypothetical protein